MGKKKSAKSSSSSSSAPSSGAQQTHTGGVTRAGSGYKTPSQFWNELKNSPNRLDEILYIRASDLRDRIYDGGNEDEIELMRTGFINLQLETGKAGWIDGVLPEGMPPTVDNTDGELLCLVSFCGVCVCFLKTGTLVDDLREVLRGIGNIFKENIMIDRFLSPFFR